MTATANQMSAATPQPVADPPEGADGPATVAPPAAPFARIVEAVDPNEHGAGFRRWFVHSDSVAGAWWKVDLIPGESLACSCPYGLRVASQPIGPAMKMCRHMRAIAARVLAERSAVA